MVETVCGLITSALAAGEGVLLCITEAHQQRVEAQLQSHGLDLRHARRRGQYVVLLTGDTLAQILDGNLPVAQRFEAVVGRAVSELAQKWPRVQAFGELVAVLCQAGNRQAAYQLEELWNGLITRYPLALLCAYPIKHFSVQDGGVTVSQICGCHTRVIPAESYSRLESADDKLLAVATLQQQALALESEIAARKQTESELAGFLENAMEGLHKIEPDGKIIWANDAELKLLGYASEEYLGRNIADFHVDPPVIEDILQKLNNGREVYNCPARLRHKSGTVVHVLIHANGYYTDGQLVVARGFSRDVTESVSAERERALLAALVGSSDDAIVSKTLEGVITSWNRAAERLFGYTAQEMIGASIVRLFPDDRVDEEQEIIAKIARGEHIRHFQTLRRRKDGSLV
ncbi:MAG: PAS domain S-box protein, partial [Planctomycetales bacterium]|nr:PAS domain S-box protein [Planctomycetales bacterium]